MMALLQCNEPIDLTVMLWHVKVTAVKKKISSLILSNINTSNNKKHKYQCFYPI